MHVALGLSVLLALAAPPDPPSTPAPPEPQLTRLPELVEYVEPVYPEEAAARGLEAEVVLRLVVDETGAVADVEVLERAGHGFDEAAVEAARRFRFAPALLGEAPVAVALEYRMGFALEAPPATRRLTGRVVRAEDGAPVAGASVFVLDREVRTDVAGAFVVDGLPAGTWRVVVMAEGHRRHDATVDLEQAEAVEVTWRLERDRAYATTIVASRPSMLRDPVELDPRPVVGRYTLSRRDVDLTPGALEDVSRVVQSLPGVAGDSDLMATFFVRGGGRGETIFYLDGVALSNPYHLGGFATLYNPELVDRVSFFASGAPAQYRSSLSGALDVRTLAADPERTRALVDVSANTAKAVASGPTPVEGLSLLLSARRSYFELYFLALRDLGVVGQRFVAPDLGEYQAKATWRGGAHRVDLTALHATDSLHFVSDPEDPALFTFDGGLRSDNAVDLVSASWRWTLASGEVTSTLAWVGDRQDLERTGGAGASEAEAPTGDLISSSASRLDSLQWRLGGRLALGRHHLGAGVEAERWAQSLTGRVEDTRHVPPWIATPIADYHRPTLDVRPSLERVALAAWVEDEWREALPGLTLRAGARFEVPDAGQGDVLLSPRLALSWSPGPATVLKAAWGRYAQAPRDPLRLDPVYGNPDLGPERSTEYVLGLEQLLPGRTLLRAEAYYKDLDDLVVNPDDHAQVEAGTTYANDGHGWARGVDVVVARRTRRVGLGLVYGYQRTERTNPLATVFERTYAPEQQQVHSVGANVDYALEDTWVFSMRYQFHTGRPYTRIGAFDLGVEDGEEVYVPVLGSDGRLNVDRLDPFHELSARVERWFRFDGWRMVLYGEVLNVTNHAALFREVYDGGDPAAATPPNATAFNHLPIRPFVGLRAEL